MLFNWVKLLIVCLTRSSLYRNCVAAESVVTKISTCGVFVYCNISVILDSVCIQKILRAMVMEALCSSAE